MNEAELFAKDLQTLSLTQKLKGCKINDLHMLRKLFSQKLDYSQVLT